MRKTEEEDERLRDTAKDRKTSRESEHMCTDSRTQEDADVNRGRKVERRSQSKHAAAGHETCASRLYEY